MTLAFGSRLGSYEITTKLGEGGMGEVYRATDTRLKREVAIKVLPAAFTDDRERLARFEREAQLLAQLNHPNIAHIYGLETSGETRALVMELVEGPTLAERLESGPLSLTESLSIALQIAQALEEAHDKGIVHRDLKPQNVKAAVEGTVKVLDFGLAKAMDPAGGSSAAADLARSPTLMNSPTLTAAHGTQLGMILGTAAYMAPEQARGGTVDKRADIWAFGVVLYEMLTGRSLFAADTVSDTLAGVLKSEIDFKQLPASTPPAIRSLLRRCLERNPKNRLHDIADARLVIDEVLRGESEAQPPASSGRLPVGGARFRTAALVAGAAVVAVGLLAGLLISRSAAPSGPSKITRLTFQRGQVDAARFAPDGQTIVFSAAWNGRPYEVFSTRSDSRESRTLGFAASVLAGISASGEMALLRNIVTGVYAQPTSQIGMLASAPLAGGPARDLAEDIQFADWSPDGKQLAVVRSQGGKYRLELPIGHVLYATGGWIADPRFSPRGDRIAFLEFPEVNGRQSAVAVVDLQGKRTVLADALTMSNGLAWSPKGDEVWFAGGRNDIAKELRAVTLSGRERVVYRALTAIHLYDVASDGRVLLAQEQRTRELWGRAAGALEDRDLTWMDNSSLNSCSFDGKSVVIYEAGEGGGAGHGVYLRAMDGSAPVRLGSGTVFDLSADGKWVLTLAQEGTLRQQLVLLPTGAGQPRELPTARLIYAGGVFSPDGKQIFFAAAKPGDALSTYVQDVDDQGAPKEFRPGIYPVPTPSYMSADGRFLVRDYAGRSLIQSLAVGDPRPIQGLAPDEAVVGFTDDGRVFVGKLLGSRILLFRVDPATGQHEAWKEILLADTTGAWPIDGACVTADGSAYVYNFPRRLSDLYLVEGLR